MRRSNLWTATRDFGGGRAASGPQLTMSEPRAVIQSIDCGRGGWRMRAPLRHRIEIDRSSCIAGLAESVPSAATAATRRGLTEMGRSAAFDGDGWVRGVIWH